jgi:hypothetical protein
MKDTTNKMTNRMNIHNEAISWTPGRRKSREEAGPEGSY